MNRGYVKLWRKSLDAGWPRNHKLWTFWTWCLLKASHHEYKQIIGCQEITLQPGQFIFGRKKAAKELRLSEQEIRTLIVFLINSGNLTIKSTNKFSIITIVNWHIYQGSIEDDQPSDQPTTNHQLTTNKNVKNEKNKTPEEILSEISEREKRYLDQETINQAFQAISSTRKTNRIADTVKLSILKSWERYPVESVIIGIRTYLDRGYNHQGKGERYLLGIIRNQQAGENESGRQVRSSTGNALLDKYFQQEGNRIT